MRIAISGSEGFLGKALQSRFQNDKDVKLIGVDKKNGLDLTEPSVLSQIPKFDVFVHLAALSYVPDSYKNPYAFYHVNINATLAALELCRLNGAKMVFISSYVYGKPNYLPVDEKHPVCAFNPYAQTKLIGEAICEGFYKDFGVPCIILRPFNIYGPGQSTLFLLASILQQIKVGNKKIKLRDPNPRRDFVFIDDVADAIKLSVDTYYPNEITCFNIASGVSYSVREVSELIVNLLSPYHPINFEFNTLDIRHSEIDETVGSFSKIKRQLGWAPSFSLEEGIKSWFFSELGIPRNI